MTNNKYQQYQTNAIMTASPQELTLMLYNGALKFCRQAIEAIKNKDIPKAHKFIVKVEDIIQEFILTLDKKYPIAKDFELLYDYIYRRLLEANTSKSIEILEEVYRLISELRDTWKEVMKKANIHLPQDVISQ